MLDEKRKYGFLTTYGQTIFLKQEQVGEEWVLFVSHVFKHTVSSIGPQSGERFFGPGDLRHKCPFGWQCLHCSGLVELKGMISLIIESRIGLFLKNRYIVGTEIPSVMSECLSTAIYKIS